MLMPTMTESRTGGSTDAGGSEGSGTQSAGWSRWLSISAFKPARVGIKKLPVAIGRVAQAVALPWRGELRL